MLKAISLFLLTATCVDAGATKVFRPPNKSNPKGEVGVVWIQGAASKPTSYYKIAQQFQKEAASRGYGVFVAIPDAVFDTPEPAVISGMISSSKTALLVNGFKGSKLIMAAHSLGTVMGGEYTKSHPSEFLGQVLMGGGVVRGDRVNEPSTGNTQINAVPTMTISGTKDGLYRISRAGEGFFH